MALCRFVLVTHNLIEVIRCREAVIDQNSYDTGLRADALVAACAARRTNVEGQVFAIRI